MLDQEVFDDHYYDYNLIIIITMWIGMNCFIGMFTMMMIIVRIMITIMIMLADIPHIENIPGTDSSYISLIRRDNIGENTLLVNTLTHRLI